MAKPKTSSPDNGGRRPVHDALDMLGRRWALRLVWELRRDALGFTALRHRLGLSPSVLAERLRELKAAGVLERDGAGLYRLSGSGRDLARILYEVNRWAEQGWSRPRRSNRGGGDSGYIRGS